MARFRNFGLKVYIDESRPPLLPASEKMALDAGDDKIGVNSSSLTIQL